MATTTNGIASWGVTSTCTGVTGVVTSLEVATEGSLAPEQNEIGAVIKMTKYDDHTTMNATIEVASGTALPEIGKAISIGGKTGFVTKASVIEDNNAYRKISVTAEAYRNCDKTTAAS